MSSPNKRSHKRQRLNKDEPKPNPSDFKSQLDASRQSIKELEAACKKSTQSCIDTWNAYKRTWLDKAEPWARKAIELINSKTKGFDKKDSKCQVCGDEPGQPVYVVEPQKGRMIGLIDVEQCFFNDHDTKTNFLCHACDTCKTLILESMSLLLKDSKTLVLDTDHKRCLTIDKTPLFHRFQKQYPDIAQRSCISEFDLHEFVEEEEEEEESDE
jgi:hypothetical protein